MKVLQNRATEFISTNFLENETAWSSTATYNYADERRDGHFIYKYAGDNGTNTIVSPALDSESLTKKWVKIRPTNYYAMLDSETRTQTQNADTIAFSIASSNYDAISLLELNAVSVQVSLTDNSTQDVIYERTIDLTDNSAVIDFASYCFEPIVMLPSIYFDDLEMRSNATINVSINAIGGTAKCGRLVAGRTYYVGETGVGVNLGIESYSKKETDVFGNTSLVHSSSVNLDSYEVHIQTKAIPNIRRKMKELDAVALLFVMDEQEESELENLLNFGYWQQFNILLSDSRISTASITIKGLI